jgi:hypothetical protein
MRLIAATSVCLVAALSLHPTPMPKHAVPVSLGLAPVVELAAQGCSLGWHRGHWQDDSGAWHWSHCFPSWR